MHNIDGKTMTQPSIEEYLSAHEFFAGLDKDSLEFLSSSASERQVEKGDVLFKQGERADRFFLLLGGQVSVQVPALMGPVLEVQNLGKDQILGWSWLIQPYRWSFMARAMADSELLEFDGTAILARCEEDPKFGYELLKRFAALMSERLDAARQKMMDQWNPPGFA